MGCRNVQNTFSWIFEIHIGTCCTNCYSTALLAPSLEKWSFRNLQISLQSLMKLLEDSIELTSQSLDTSLQQTKFLQQSWYLATQIPVYHGWTSSRLKRCRKIKSLKLWVDFLYLESLQVNLCIRIVNFKIFLWKGKWRYLSRHSDTHKKRRFHTNVCEKSEDLRYNPHSRHLIRFKIFYQILGSQPKSSSAHFSKYYRFSKWIQC